MERLNLYDPYMNQLRNRLLTYEHNYNLNQEDSYDDDGDDYKYLPINLRGGSLHNTVIPSDVRKEIQKVIEKYHAIQHLHGSGIGSDIWKGVKKGAKYAYDSTVSFEAFKGTLKKMIWDNAYVMACLKIGVGAAATALVSSLGGPPGLVAAMPLILALSEAAVKDYWERKQAIDYRNEKQNMNNEVEGEGFNTPNEIQKSINKLINKYHAREELQGSGIGKEILKKAKQGAKYVFDNTVSFEAFKGTLKKMVWDNEYVMAMIKLGVVRAAQVLAASLGIPPDAVPLIIALSEAALKEYWKRKEAIDYRNELKNRGDIDEEGGLLMPFKIHKTVKTAKNIYKGQGLKEWGDLAERATIHGINAAREYHQTKKAPIHSIKSLNKDWEEFSSKKLKGGARRKRVMNGISPVDLRYTVGDLPMKRPQPIRESEIPDDNNLDSYLSGGAKKKPKRQQSDRQKRRAALIKKIMKQEKCNLGAASKYISDHELKY